MSTASRMQQARPAVRPALKGRLMLSAPSGGGKSRSGLMIATVLAEILDEQTGAVTGHAPILGIDTERESLLTYADDFTFVHLPWRPPYAADELSDVITAAGKEYGVVMIDSLSHFWRKEGGVLDVANGKFTGWGEARPMQEALVEAILGCDAHVILCVRSKVAHSQEVEHGKIVVRKLGMAPQQDDDLEFELNVAFELSMDHTASVSKSRTTVLPIGTQFRGGQIAEMARLYRDWLKGGEPPAAKTVVVELQKRMAAVEPLERRKAVKNEFLARFGRPEQLRESQAADAEALVASYENPDAPQHPSAPPSPQVPQPPAPTATGAPAKPNVSDLEAAIADMGRADLVAELTSRDLTVTKGASDGELRQRLAVIMGQELAAGATEELAASL